MKNSTLPKGIFSKKQNSIQNLTVLILLIISIINLYLLKISSLFIFLYIPIILSYIIIISKTQPINIILKELYNDLQIFKCLKNLNHLYDNNLHPDTLNGLNIYKAKEYAQMIIDSKTDIPGYLEASNKMING